MQSEERTPVAIVKDGSLSEEAIASLKNIKDILDVEYIDINRIIISINRDIPPEDIVMMLGDNAKSYIDADDGHVFTRVILMMMGSEQRRAVMTSYGSSLVAIIMRAIIPIGDDEKEMQKDMDFGEYITEVLGEQFVEDIKYISTIPTLSEFTRRWIKTQLSYKYARKPEWVNIVQFDSSNAFKPEDWKCHRTSKEVIKEIARIPETEEEAFADESDIPMVSQIDHDDGHIIGDFGYDVEESAAAILRDRFSTVPKRAMTLRSGGMMPPGRAFGPLNSHLRDECESGLDGCRMLVCACDQDEITQKCEVCNLKIRDRSYTVRYPEADGGWSGEFCSIMCMKSEYMGNSRLADLAEELKSTGVCDRRAI